MDWWVDGLMGSLVGLGARLGGQKGPKGSQREPKWRPKGPKGTQKDAKKDKRWNQKATMGDMGGRGRKKVTQGPPREDPQAFLQGSRPPPGGQNIVKVQ